MIRPRRARAVTFALVVASSGIVAHAREASAQQQPVIDANAEAGAQFRRGRSLYDAQHYPEALEAFRTSLELLPSPATRIYVARSLRRIPGHMVEAYREYRRATSEAEERAADEPRYAPVANAARIEAGEIAGAVAVVTLVFPAATPPGVNVQIDGQPVASEEITREIPLEPGAHLVEAQAPGYLRFRQAFDIPTGNTLRVAVNLVADNGGSMGSVRVPEQSASTGGSGSGFVMTPVQAPMRANVQRPLVQQVPGPGEERDDPGSGLRRGGGVFIGIGAVLLVAGAISAGFALGTYNGLVHDCGEGLCPDSVQDVPARVTRGRTAGIIGTVGMATGGGFILLGAVLFGIGKSREHTAWQVASHVMFDPMAGTVGIHGTF